MLQQEEGFSNLSSSNMKKILETTRLLLREFTLEDAPFVLELVNTPTWLQFIGDRGVRNLEDARHFLENGNLKSYAEYGFGFYAVGIKESETLIGMCGLVKRDSLDDVDIGFAFLPDAAGKGYGYEIASATLTYAKETLKLQKVIAIVNPENKASIGLIEKLGLVYEKRILLPPTGKELLLFSIEFNS